MKRYFAAVAFVMMALCASIGSYAQNGDPAAREAQMKQKLMTDLKMTSVQADSVVAINRAYRPQMRDIFMDQSMSQDDKKDKMKAITDQEDKRIQPVLGDSLYVQYKAWRKEYMMQMRGGAKPGGN